MMPALDPELLLRHRGWLTALARQLACDRDGADDLVQSTWQAALERPPRARDESSLRAWLGRVLRNAARAAVRGETRRRHRERLSARPERQPSVTDSLEAFAEQRRIVEAVLELESPMREIVVLRYFEDQPPRVIAERLGLTRAAVRSRLHRALAVLRARLRAGEGDDRQRPSRAPLAVLPCVLAKAPARTAVAIGGFWMKSKLFVVAAVAVALVTAGWWLGALQGVAPPPVSPDAGAPVRLSSSMSLAERGRAPVLVAAARRRSTVAQALAVPAAAPVEVVVLRGRCIDAAGVPLAGVNVELNRVKPAVSAVSAADGRFELTADWPIGRPSSPWTGDLLLSGPALARRPERITLESPGAHELGDLTLQAGGTVVGRVVDVRGEPIEGARVVVWRPELAGPREECEAWGCYVFGWTTAFTGADGRFRLQGVPAARLRVAASWPGMLYGWSEPMSLLAGDEVRVADLVLVEPGPERRITGHVLSPEGGGVAGARVSIVGESGPSGGATSSAADGAFELVVPPHSRFRLRVEDIGRRWSAIDRRGATPGGPALELRFAAPVSFTVEVRDQVGRPVEHFIVVPSDRPRRLPLPAKPLAAGCVEARAPAAKFWVGIVAPGYRFAAQGPFDAKDMPERVTFVLETAARVRGVVHRDGEPLVARVHAHRVLEQTRTFSEGFPVRVDPTSAPAVETDPDGHFELPIDRPGRYVLHVEAKGCARAEVGPLEVAEGSSVGPLAIDLSAGGSLTGRLITAAGVSNAGRVVAASHGDGHVLWQRTGEDGSYRFEGLMPGTWYLRRVAAGRVPLLASPGTRPASERDLPELRAEITDGQSTTADLDVSAEQPCVVRGRFVVDGVVPAHDSFWIANRLERVFPALDGSGRFDARLSTAGAQTLVLRRDRAGDPEMFYASLALAPGRNELSYEVTTGTLLLRGVEAGCELRWRRDDLQWSRQIPAGPSVRRVEAVPVGTVEARGRRVELRAGATLELDLR